jgi:hypothetical protein
VLSQNIYALQICSVSIRPPPPHISDAFRGMRFTVIIMDLTTCSVFLPVLKTEKIKLIQSVSEILTTTVGVCWVPKNNEKGLHKYGYLDISFVNRSAEQVQRK